MGSQYLEATAAMCGRGLALVAPALFATELRSGALVQPFPIHAEEQRHYFLVYPEAKRNIPKIRAFRTWMLDAMRDYQTENGDLLQMP